MSDADPHRVGSDERMRTAVSLSRAARPANTCRHRRLEHTTHRQRRQGERRCADLSRAARMLEMRIAVGADHAGFALKEHLKSALRRARPRVRGSWRIDETPTDYPPICAAVGRHGRGGRGRAGRRARRQRAGRTDRGQQGGGRPRRPLQRPVHGAPVAAAQRRQRAGDRRPHRRARARARDSDLVAGYALRGRHGISAASSRLRRSNGLSPPDRRTRPWPVDRSIPDERTRHLDPVPHAAQPRRQPIPTLRGPSRTRRHGRRTGSN